MSRSSGNSGGLFILLIIVITVSCIYYFNTDTGGGILDGDSPNTYFHPINVPNANVNSRSSTMDYKMTSPVRTTPGANINTGIKSSPLNQSGASAKDEYSSYDKKQPLNVVSKIKENGSAQVMSSEGTSITKTVKEILKEKEASSYISQPVTNTVALPAYSLDKKE